MDYSLSPPTLVAKDLGQRLERLRLSRNLRRTDLASAAGLSVGTLARLETTGRATLESLVRVMTALKLSDHLEFLLPDATLRPIERADTGGRQRRRARPAKVEPTQPWSWAKDS